MTLHPLPALAAALALALVSVVPVAAATLAVPEPGACVGAACPPGMLACVTGVPPWHDVCLVRPLVNCLPVTWLDETIGPLHVMLGGCGAHAELHDGLVVLP